MRTVPPFNMEADGKKAGEVTGCFKNVPPGDYVVNAFHDADATAS